MTQAFCFSTHYITSRHVLVNPQDDNDLHMNPEASIDLLYLRMCVRVWLLISSAHLLNPLEMRKGRGALPTSEYIIQSRHFSQAGTSEALK